MIKCMLIMILFCLTLVACAKTDQVTFITSTQIGIDADATTQHLDIGYSRQEGTVGPVYENGAVPPVYAEVKSNLSVVNTEIQQFYATGDAAEIIAGDSGKELDDDRYKLKGKRKTMFFGTSSNFGLRAGFKMNLAPSINLGYKRQELSVIPIHSRNGAGEDEYGSTFARIDIGSNISGFKDSKVKLNQLIATGRAADLLANDPRIKANVRKRATQASKLTCGAGDSIAAKIIQQKVLNSQDDKAVLQAWMDTNGMKDMSITMFIFGDCFPAEQAQAALDLQWAQ